MAKLYTLTDEFNGNSYNATNWPSAFNTSTITVNHNRLIIGTTLDTNYHGLASAALDLTSAYAQIQIMGIGDQTLSSYEVYPLEVYQSSDSTNALFWLISGSNIAAYKKVAGTNTSLASATYDATVHRFVRIRENGGTTYFEYSADAKTWTILTSLANPFTLTSIICEITVGTYSTESRLTAAAFANFNVMQPLPINRKSYAYRVTRQGNYLGNMPNVTSEFNYSQDVNSAGTQITVTVAQVVDVAQLPNDTIDDENGNPIQDEAGDDLRSERQNDVVGNNTDDILIRNGNHLDVWEYSWRYPSGKQMFSGEIDRWEAPFSDGGSSEEISILAYSDGQELSNYVMAGSTSDTLDQSQTDAPGNWSGFNYQGDPSSGTVGSAQTVTAGSLADNITKISIMCSITNASHPFTATLSVYNSVTEFSQGKDPIAASSVLISNTSTGIYNDFRFANPPSITPGQQYFMLLTCNATYADYQAGHKLRVDFGSGSGDYSGGTGYLYQSKGSPTLQALGSGQDMVFKTYYGVYTTDTPYTNEDVSQIVTDFMNYYNSSGGIIRLPSGGLTNTGIGLSYTFKLATILEGVQKAIAAAPSNWFWYVDVGSNTLQFKATNDTADHIIIRGRHINKLNLVASIENVANTEYFSGGNVGDGTNLYRKYVDQTSVNNFGVKIARSSDNRVTLSSTADALGNAALASSKDEQYQTTVTIPDIKDDITIYKPGDTVKFSGFGGMVDTLTLQIVRIEYHPDSITLTLGQLPPRLNVTVQQLQNQLAALQTIANPSSPS